MSSVRSGLILSSIERYGVLLMGLATTFVTARLLTPADFGIAIIGMAIFGLIDIFRDFGGGTYIIQIDETTPARVQTVFTVTLLLALPLFVFLFFFSAEIASFYGSPGLQSYLHVSAWCLLLSSFSSPAYALLCRNLQFGKLTMLSLTSTTLNSLLTIALALMGFSYMSYAWGQLLASVVYFGLCVAWGPKFPIYRFSLTEWRRVTSYGIYDSARALLNHLGDAAPFLAFGKTIGTEALGLYQRSLTVSRLPERTVLAGITPVLQPAFSKHAREGQNLSRSFLLGVEHVTVLLWPALIGIVLLAHPLVMILLGPQWTATVPIVQIMATSFLVWFPMNLPRPALVAVGAVRDTALIALLTVPVMVGVQIAASFHGLTAIAWSFFAANIYAVLVSMYFVRRNILLPWGALLRAMRKSAIVTVISAVPSLFMVIWMGGTEHLTIADGIGTAMMSAAWWFLAIHWASHPIKNEIARAIEAIGAATIPPSALRNLKSIRVVVSSRVFDGRKSSGYDPDA